MTHQIKSIHLIFKTHLDIGFTDLARRVVATYFDSYIPQAIETAALLRQRDQGQRFIWTTGSWLIDEYLENASPSSRRSLEKAVEAGDITWHGLPFTMHSELMDVSLFRAGLSLSQKLDRRFGRTTIAAKMTDIPGHTRGIVPLLAEAGILFLHIGVNEASTLPNVPPLFVWRDDSGAETIVMYQHGYGDLMLVPGTSHAIMFAHTHDNLGPQTVDQVLDTYACLQKEFPQASIVASTLDTYARHLMQVKPQLPVIAGEIADTWIHGAGTDPRKVAHYRELLRLRKEWLTDGRIGPDDLDFHRFSKFMLMVPEHTWGMDEKTHLADYTHYSRKGFERVRNSCRFRSFAASWSEQRAYLDDAISSLADSAFSEEARSRLDSIEPAVSPTIGFERVADLSASFDTQFFTISFDQPTGAIGYLRDKRDGWVWADGSHLAGWVRYQTFSQADYDRFIDQYLDSSFDWALADFSKPGIAQAGAESGWWQPTLLRLYRKADIAGHRFVLRMAVPGQPVVPYGCPREFYLEVFQPRHEPALQFVLQWFGKSASRLPEALWFSFCPIVTEPNGWLMEKLGQWISPLEVIGNGNRKLHAIERRLVYNDGERRLTIESSDAPLVAPGEPSLLNFDDQQPVLAKGMHLNLYNNIWGTNYPMWYDEDARFRFKLSFGRERELNTCDTITYWLYAWTVVTRLSTRLQK